MGETFQAVVVTAVAAGALLVLIRPLFARRRPAQKPGGCASCASAPPTSRAESSAR